MDNSNLITPTPTGSSPSVGPTSPVMDIQPPQPSVAARYSAPVATMPLPTEAPSPTPPSPPAPPPSPVMPPADGPVIPADSMEQGVPIESNPMAAKPQGTGAPKKKKTGIVVIIAIVIALVLGGVAFMLWSKSNSKSDKKADTAQPATSEIQPATAEDVDDTINEIDSSLTATDDAKDFGTADLTDTTLGL